MSIVWLDPGHTSVMEKTGQAVSPVAPRRFGRSLLPLLSPIKNRLTVGSSRGPATQFKATDTTSTGPTDPACTRSVSLSTVVSI